MTANPYANREASVDLVILFSTQGLQGMFAEADKAYGDAAAEQKTELAAKLEWALRTLGITHGEMQAAGVRLRAASATYHAERDVAHLEELFNLPPAADPTE